MEGSSIDDGDSRPIGRIDVRAVALTVIVGAGTVYGVRAGVSLLAPVLVSALLAYAMEPLVRAICRWRLPRSAAVVVASALLLGALVIAGGFARRQLIAFVDALPPAVRDLRTSLARARRDTASGGVGGSIAHLQHAATEIDATLKQTGPPPTPGVARVVRTRPSLDVRALVGDFAVAVGTASVQFLAIGLLTLFLLLGGEALKRKLIAIAGPHAQRKVTHDIIKAIDRQIERYLLARLLISAIVAGATWLGLWCLGVRQPLVLGLIAGVLNVMPFIGPAVAVALIGVVAFLQFHTAEAATAAILVSGAIAALEGNLISPWLTSRAGELNTVAVFVSVLFWGWMWDVWGLVLAIPIMVAIKAAADHIDPLQPLGELLGR